MEDIYKTLLVTTTFVMVFGFVSKYVKNKLFLPESLISILFGILIGHHCFNLFDTNYVYSKILLYNFSRIVLCIQTMSVAMSLPKSYIINKGQSIFFLVLVVGVVKCVFSFILIYLFSRYNATISWSLAACLTPTDPILSSSIIKGRFAKKMVPERIRLLLSAESGINDGMGILLLYFGFYIINYSSGGLTNFILDTLFLKVFISAIIGLLVGVISRQCLRYCYYKDLVGVESFIIHGIILTLFSLGLMELLGGSELVCIFCAGITFSFDEWFILETKNSMIQEILDGILSTGFFVFFGSRIHFNRFTVTNVLVSLVIITIRRPLVCRFLYKWIPELKTPQESWFVGWFGPIGVGALYYALMTDKLQETLAIDYVSTTVFLSVLIHGLTIPFVNVIRYFFPDIIQGQPLKHGMSID